jgi:predicted DNA-binding protein (UPF0251 family)
MKNDFAHEHDLFRETLKSLPAGQREALILADQSGFSYEEAAQICGCTVRAFKNRADHARSQLAEIYPARVVDGHLIVRAKGLGIKIVLSTKADNQNPPQLAELLLLLFAMTHHAEAQVGDLNERFTRDCEDIGRDRAVRLYWARTLRSLWPLLVRAIGKALKWGAVVAALRRLF